MASCGLTTTAAPFPIYEPNSLMPPEEKRALINNIAGHMSSVPERIRKLRIEHFTKADPAYGRDVAEALGIGTPTPELASVSKSQSVGARHGPAP
jgi:catalase